jgi:lipopolysaccharide/colanic/teichoic acid biosynthesis glycosyltransferase
MERAGKGDMSLVGPRPEVRRYVSATTRRSRRVLALTSGITDPASLKYFDEERCLQHSPIPSPGSARGDHAQRST